CRSEQVSPHRFHAWKRKLFPAARIRRTSGNAIGKKYSRQVFGKPQARAHQTSTYPAAPPHPTAFLQLPVTTAPGSPWIELALADGTILRLPQQNLAALVTALRVLRG